VLLSSLAFQLADGTPGLPEYLCLNVSLDVLKAQNRCALIDLKVDVPESVIEKYGQRT
jgi:hypothetical protein